MKALLFFSMVLKETPKENTPLNKKALTRGMNMEIWVVCASKQLFTTGSYGLMVFKKNSYLVSKLHSLG